MLILPLSHHEVVTTKEVVPYLILLTLDGSPYDPGGHCGSWYYWSDPEEIG